MTLNNIINRLNNSILKLLYVTWTSLRRITNLWKSIRSKKYYFSIKRNFLIGEIKMSKFVVRWKGKIFPFQGKFKRKKIVLTLVIFRIVKRVSGRKRNLKRKREKEKERKRTENKDWTSRNTKHRSELYLGNLISDDSAFHKRSEWRIESNFSIEI